MFSSIVANFYRNLPRFDDDDSFFSETKSNGVKIEIDEKKFHMTLKGNAGVLPPLLHLELEGAQARARGPWPNIGILVLKPKAHKAQSQLSKELDKACPPN